MAYWVCDRLGSRCFGNVEFGLTYDVGTKLHVKPIFREVIDGGLHDTSKG